MPPQVITRTEELFKYEEYKAEWDIHYIDSKLIRNRSLRTPVFFPVPNVELGFFFEMWCQQKHHAEHLSCSSTFKLSLRKTVYRDIPAALKMIIKVDVCNQVYFNFLKEYAPSPEIVVNEMTSYDFKDVSSAFNDTNTNRNGTNRFSFFCKMSSAFKGLILKCNLKFFGHLSLSAPQLNELASNTPSSLELFAKDFQSIYGPSAMSDVKFIIGNECLPAHKSVLAAHSPVFLHSLFSSQFLFTVIQDSVTIVDTTHENFENFLKYLYSGEIEDKSLVNIKNLLYLADKYDVFSLRRECAKMAATHLSIEKVVDILILVHESHDLEILYQVKKFASTHIKELLNKEKWKDLLASHLVIAYEVMAEVQRISDRSVQSETFPVENES